MENKNEIRKINKFQEYSLYFFIFAIFGWIMETIYSFIVLGHFTERGFLYGPLCPIYGYGALIMILFLSKYKNKPLRLFISSVVIFSILEYIVSYVLEVLFDMYFWNYEHDFFNINSRIALFYSLAWGFITLLFNSYIYPFVKKILIKITNKIPSKILENIIYITFSVYIIDTILSFVRYLN